MEKDLKFLENFCLLKLQSTENLKHTCYPHNVNTMDNKVKSGSLLSLQIP